MSSQSRMRVIGSWGRACGEEITHLPSGTDLCTSSVRVTTMSVAVHPDTVGKKRCRCIDGLAEDGSPLPKKNPTRAAGGPLCPSD
jgi:hypothetical protein